jgi:hypothetical protein
MMQMQTMHEMNAIFITMLEMYPNLGILELMIAVQSYPYA